MYYDYTYHTITLVRGQMSIPLSPNAGPKTYSIPSGASMVHRDSYLVNLCNAINQYSN